VSTLNRLTTLNTCLAIATQKGTSRSGEFELKSLGEKSSLARSQNLSAELSRPTGGELKLKIKRKFICLDNDTRFSPEKKFKPKVRKTTYFEKKELRSTTLAATKASSSLAAVANASKDICKLKDQQTDGSLEHSEITRDDKPETCSDELNICSITSKEIHRTVEPLKDIECDSSADSAYPVQSSLKESPRKDNLTSQIAAALSSQKGLWQLSNQKKKFFPSTTENQDEEQAVPAGQEACWESKQLPNSSSELEELGKYMYSFHQYFIVTIFNSSPFTLVS
jgi:hypothetical protein